MNGTTYNDAFRFELDEAQKKTNNHTWYFDQFGNLIGAVEVATQYNYAVVKDMWWYGENATGTGKAMANLVYMDGTENTVEVKGVQPYTVAKMATPVHANPYKNDTMAIDNGLLYVDDYIANNDAADTTYDIIRGNMFQVQTLNDGSVKLVEVENELKDVAIISKYAVANGTAAKGFRGTSFNTNVNTQYLILNGDKFESVKGFNDIANFFNSKAKSADFVDVNGDGYADYVYIIGTPDTAKTQNFVMPMSANYSEVLKTSGNVKYYELTLNMIGSEETTLKVLPDDYNTVVTNGLLKTVNGKFVNLNKLFYVTFDNGFAKTVTLIDAIGMKDPALAGLAANLRASKFVDSDNNKIVRNGNDVLANGVHFNVTSATEIIGTLPEGRQTGKIVYAVTNASDNVAEKVWVVDNPDYAPNAGAQGYAIHKVNVTIGDLAHNGRLDNVKITAKNGTNELDMDYTVTWYVKDAGAHTERAAVAGEIINSGSSYRAVVTVSVKNADAVIKGAYLDSDLVTNVAFGGETTSAKSATVSTNLIEVQ